ncbi:aldo/keto reductase [Streptomyces sp. NPDC005438]|uniref:aldo/keto reductase n=1 Tax=Streptomyces sp. NPDC005438 TaxID=3156880 RepID=UPI0033B73206
MNSAAHAGDWNFPDHTVHRIGLGAMRLTPDRAPTLLRRARELGVNHLDTAAFYGDPPGTVNALIRDHLAPYPDDLLLATKVWPARDRDGNWTWARPEQLRQQVEDNLRTLGRDHLDLVNLRLPPSHAESSLADHFGALAQLRQAGLVRHLGLSHIRRHHLDEAQAIAPVVCVQNPYGIGAPTEERRLLQYCGGRDIAYVPYFSIAGDGREKGALPPEGEHPEVLALARELQVSTARLRVAWTLAQGSHVLAIPGTGNPEHLADNLAAGTLRLSPEQRSRLDALGA